MNPGEPGLLTSMEKPTKSGSGLVTSIPSRHMRSPRQSLTVSDLLVTVLVKSFMISFPKLLCLNLTSQ